jgi:hypothetical protein
VSLGSIRISSGIQFCNTTTTLLLNHRLHRLLMSELLSPWTQLVHWSDDISNHLDRPSQLSISPLTAINRRGHVRFVNLANAEPNRTKRRVRGSRSMKGHFRTERLPFEEGERVLDPEPN